MSFKDEENITLDMRDFMFNVMLKIKDVSSDYLTAIEEQLKILDTRKTDFEDVLSKIDILEEALDTLISIDLDTVELEKQLNKLKEELTELEENQRILESNDTRSELETLKEEIEGFLKFMQEQELKSSMQTNAFN